MRIEASGDLFTAAYADEQNVNIFNMLYVYKKYLNHVIVQLKCKRYFIQLILFENTYPSDFFASVCVRYIAHTLSAECELFQY